MTRTDRGNCFPRALPPHKTIRAVLWGLIAVLVIGSVGCSEGVDEPPVDGGETFDSDHDADADVGPADADADSDVDSDADVEDDSGGDADFSDDADVDLDADDAPVVVDPYLDGPLGVTEESVRVGMGGGWPTERNIDVDIYLPTDLSGAPYPVVIYSHGFQLTGSHYATTGQRMASHGLVAVLPSYGDNMISPRSHTDLAADVTVLIDWVIEQTATEGTVFHGVADSTRVGAGGHSRGGKHSILAATLDSRILATFDVDPVDAGHPLFGETDGYPSVTPELMGDLTVPSGFVGAGRSAEATMGQACAPEAQNYHQYFVAASTPAFEYLLTTAGHLDFADRCGLICSTCRAGDDPEWNRAFAAATMLSFYRFYLADDGRYRPWIDGDAVTRLAESVTFDSR